MKKIMISIAALVLAASCVNKVEIKTPENEIGLKAVTVTTSEDTKVAYADGYGMSWYPGEKAGIVNADANIESESLEKIKEGGFEATFEFKAAAGTYTLYQPYNEGSVNGAIKFAVNPVQEQEKPGLADTWFASRFPLIGKEDVTLSGEEEKKPAETSYKVVGSIVRFYIGGISNEAAGYGEYLRSVTIEANKTIAGTIETDNTGAISTVENGSESVKVLTYQQLIQGKPENNGVYAIVVPVEGAMVTYTVRTSYATYEFTMPNAVTWAQNTKYDVYLNLAKATKTTADTTPERLFIIGNGCNAGWAVQNGIELEKQTDGVTFKGQVVLYQGGEFRFSAQRCNGEFTDNYAKGADNTKIQQWVSSNDVPNFTVENGAGLYDITVNTQDMTVAFEHLAPYFVGSTNPMHWDVPGDPAVSGPIQMTAVEGMPGVFTLDVDWGNNGADFKFLAKADTWEYAYLCADTAEAGSFDFNKNTILDDAIVFTRFVDNDNKWNVGGYDCYPSVTYILDTKNMTLTCVPRLAVIGGNWEGSGWQEGDWVEFAEKPGHKMTLDVANTRWYIDVTIPAEATDQDFKIFSHGTWGYGQTNGVWLKADGSHTWVGLKGSDNIYNAYVANNGDNDDKWHLMTSEGVITGNIRISLDYSTWANGTGAGKIYYEKL